jgi:hypothetical protein
LPLLTCLYLLSHAKIIFSGIDNKYYPSTTHKLETLEIPIMPKPTVRKSRKSVKRRALNKSRKTHKKQTPTLKMLGGSEEEKTNNQIETSCADYETDEQSCLENPVCDFINKTCITSYCTTKYGYNKEKCIENGCSIDRDTKLCVPSDEKQTQRIQEAKTKNQKIPAGNLSFMMY